MPQLLETESGKFNSLSLNCLQEPPQVPLEEALQRARKVISNRAGVISSVQFEELMPGEPRVFFARSNPANVSTLLGQLAVNYGDAVSVDPNRATIKAVGESIERYCSALYDEKHFLFSTYHELGEHAVDPNLFALFSEKQYSVPDFPYARITKNTPLNWVKGFSLTKDKFICVPAGFVYVPYEFDEPLEKTFHDPISTGLACGSSLASAIYKSILEVIERDAFMIFWENGLILPQIDPWSSNDPLVHRLLEAIEGVPVQVHALLITLDIDVPVILVILSSQSGLPPHTVLGISADLDPNKALVSALEEAFLSFLGMKRYVKIKSDFQPGSNYENLVTPVLHALTYALCPELKTATDFITNSNPKNSIKINSNSFNGSMIEKIRFLVNMLDKKDLETIILDLTTPDIDEVGFKVVRAVIPGMEPLHINHSRKYLGGKRLYEVPKILNLAKAPYIRQNLNPYPHPFP